MFSGIVETTSKINAITFTESTMQITVERPEFFNDLAIGHSVAVNGVCLTVEKFDANEMVFTLGPETLKITGWKSKLYLGAELNLERSLKFSDRIHGSLVTGHVDNTARVVEIQRLETTLIMKFEISSQFKIFVWNKGTICVNGVSLTINNVKPMGSSFEIEVCLIPETLTRTNLKNVKIDDMVTIEYDYVAKILTNAKGDMHELHT